MHPNSILSKHCCRSSYIFDLVLIHASFVVVVAGFTCEVAENPCDFFIDLVQSYSHQGDRAEEEGEEEDGQGDQQTTSPRNGSPKLKAVEAANQVLAVSTDLYYLFIINKKAPCESKLCWSATGMMAQSSEGQFYI